MGLALKLIPECQLLYIGFSLPLANALLDNDKLKGRISFSLIHLIIREDFITRAKEANSQCFAWTVNDASLLPQLIKMGIDGVVTDHPEWSATLLLNDATTDDITTTATRRATIREFILQGLIGMIDLALSLSYGSPSARVADGLAGKYPHRRF